MRISRYLGSVAVLAVLLCCSVALGQTAPATAVPFISQVTPPSIAPAPNSSLIVQFSLTILGANFPQNPVVKLTLPQGPSLYASSASVNATGSQIVAQFNTTLPRPAVYAVTVVNAVNNPTAVSNVFYLPVTPSATTVAISQNPTGFLTGIPAAMATGDFNGDGNVDVAVVSEVTNTVSIFLGTFGGSLNPGAAYPTGNTPSGIVAADFNGDGVLDLAFTNARDNTVTILLGNGDGTFRADSTINDPGAYPTKIVAADFNGDGRMDLAVVNVCGPVPALCYPEAGPPGPGSVLVLLGNGDGTFSVSPAFPRTGNVPWAIAAADLNSDGAIDLVVANQSDNNLTLLMGNGDGTFTPAQSPVPTGNGPSAIAIGDFNGDGKLDLAVTNSADNTVSILLSQSCGLPSATCTFSAAPLSPAVGVNPSAISAGDMNADGSVDLVVTNGGSNSISVLLGNGTGGFTAVLPQLQWTFSTGTSPVAVALADFSGDGRLDIATINQSGSYSILTQTGVPQVVLTTSNNSPTYGMNVTFTANVNPSIGTQPTGTVTLFDGTTSLGTVALSGYQANFFISTLQTGTHQITATYNGDSNFLASTSPAVMETVSQAQTNLTLTSNVNMVPYGQPFTLSATVVISNLGSPTGTVTFYEFLGSTIGTATVANGVAQLTLSTLSPGAHVITARYGGDANFLGSSSQTYTENITQASTTTSVTTSASPVSLGQTPTFTATVQPSGSAGATGFMIFFADGSTSLGAVQIANNSAQLRAPVLSVGPHSITAQYTGDTNYTGSTSSPILEMVNPDADNVILSTSPTVYGQTATFVASVQGVNYSGTATGTMTFSDGSTVLGIAPLSNGSAQFTASGLAVGTHPISASYSGDANFQAGTSAQVATNVWRASATTVVSSGQNPSAFSQAVLLTANVQPAFGGAATGNVTFLDGAVTLGTSTLSGNVAVLSVSSFTVGAHSISAAYVGDSNVNGSASTPVTQTVNPSPTSVTLISNANPSTYGQNVTFAATVKAAFGTAPASTVSFYDGATLLGTVNTATASPQITIFTLTTGTHSITAQYAGNGNFASSTSTALTQTVNQAASLIVVSSNANPSTFGQSVTLNASISTPEHFSSANSGTLTFLDNGASIGSVTLPGNTNFATLATTALSTGAHSITVSYGGDANFAAGTSAVFTQTVNLEPTTTLIASSTYTPAFAQSITLTATVKPSSGTTATGTVTFLDRTTTLGTATLSNNAAQMAISTLAPGTHYISAQYSGDANTAASTSGQTLVTVSPPPTTTLLSSSQNPSSLNQPVTFTATLQLTSSGTPTGTVTFFDGSYSLGTATVLNGSAQFTDPGFQIGTHSITAVYGGDANFSGSTSAALSQVVNLGPTTTVVTSSSNPSIAGYNVTFTVSVYPPYGGMPNGLVTLFDGSTSLGSANLTNLNGQNYALYTLSTLTTGAHAMTAKYNGNVSFAPSTSPVFTQTVNLPATSTYLASNYNPAPYGETLSLVASVQPPGNGSATGTVTFFDGATSLGTASVSNNLAQLSVPTLSLGSHTLTAQYSGDSKFAGSTSAPVTETINVSTTTTTVSPNISPSNFDQTVVFTAVVVSSGGGTVTGSVTFLDGTTSLGTATVSSNVAQLSLSSLSVGSHSITAKYSGDGNFTASTSSPVTQTVNQAYTMIAVASNLNPATFGQSVVFTATVQPSNGGITTGNVTFLDGTTSLGTATVSSNVAQLSLANLSAGSHSITAKYSGDGNFTGSTSSSVAQTVNQASTTIAVASNLNPAVFGQAVVFTATVQSSGGGTATGTVTFLDGSTSLGTATVSSNTAQLSPSSLSVGSHPITAKYSGDTNFAASTSAAVTQTVTQATTVTTVASSLNPATFGQSVTFTVTVQPSAGGTPTGTVTLVDGGTNALANGTVSAGGTAQFTVGGLSTGSHSMTVVYAGDANFSASTSPALVETVNAASTTTVLSSSLDPSAFDQSVTFTATVQPAGGTTATGAVTFMDGSTALGSATLSSNSAQLVISALTVGTHSITAVYAGTTNLSGSTSAALSQVVNGAATTTAVSSSANLSTFGQGVTLSATIQTAFGGNATGTITFLDGTTSLGTATVSSNGAQLSLSSLSAGSHSIAAKYNGDANFSGSTSAVLTQTVNQASTTIAIVSGTNPSVFGQNVTFTASVQSSSSGTPTGNVTFFDGSTSLGSVNLSGSSAQLTLASFSLGSHSITAKYNGDSNYAASSSANFAQSVGQSGSTTTLSSNANPSSFGQAVTFTATVQPSYSGTPTGTVTFFDGGTSLGSIGLTGGSAQLTLSSLSLGAHSISAKYGGDSNFTTSTSTSIAESVNQAGTSTTVSSNTNPSSYGQVVTFTATVTPAYGGAPTGNVTFFDGSTSLGNSNLSGGLATFSTAATALTAGSHSITAKYNGDVDFLTSTSAAVVQTVGPAATVTTLASNVNPSPTGQSVNFTAHVSSAVSGNLTGTVNFYLDGGTTPVFSVALSGGNAQYTTSSLSGGTHSLTAAFVSTNSNFSGSTSTSLTQSITDFSISASPASETIPRASSATYTLTLTPIGGLSGNVSLSCNGAPGNTTCSISPNQVTWNGVNSAQASVTVTVSKHATVGTYTLTLKGTSGSITHSTTVTLTIN
jgi:hypothetical protein